MCVKDDAFALFPKKSVDVQNEIIVPNTIFDHLSNVRSTQHNILA